MLAIVTSVDHYMLGYTLREQHNRDREADGRGGMEQPSYVRALLAGGKFPHLKSVFDAAMYGQESFEQGVGAEYSAVSCSRELAGHMT